MVMALHEMYHIKVMAHTNVWFRQGVSATENLAVKIVEAIFIKLYLYRTKEVQEHLIPNNELGFLH